MNPSLRQSITLAAFLVSAASSASTNAQTLTTSFTYQGELQDSGSPANGSYDLQFRALSAATGGTQVGPTLCVNDVLVVNGRLTVVLDFGLDGSSLPVITTGRHLEISVRSDAALDCANATGFVPLSPRQAISPAPLATTALVANTAMDASTLQGANAAFFQNAANLTGTINDAVLGSSAARRSSANTFTAPNIFSATNTFTDRVQVGSSAAPMAILDVRGGNSTTPVLNVEGADDSAVSLSAGRGAEAVFKGGDQNGSTPAQRALIRGGDGTTRGGNVELRSGGAFSGDPNTQGGDILLLPGQGPGQTQRGRVGINTLTPTSAFTVLGGGPVEPVMQVRGDAGSSIDLIAGDIFDIGGLTQVGGVLIKGGRGGIANNSLSKGGNVTLEAGQGGTATGTAQGGRGGHIVLRTGKPGEQLTNPNLQGSPGGVGINVESPLALLHIAEPGAATGPTTLDSLRIQDRSPSISITSTDNAETQVSFTGSPALSQPSASIRFTPGATPSLRMGFGSRDDLTLPDTGDILIGTASNARNLRVAGSLTSVGSVTAPTFIGGLSGSATNATNLNNQPASFYTNASNLSTGTVPDARLSGNIARTNAGNVFTGAIEALSFIGPLIGNASTATTASNATNLGGQAAGFYQNASNLTSGTLADARLSSNIPRLSTQIIFPNSVIFQDLITFDAPAVLNSPALFNNGMILAGTEGLAVEDPANNLAQFRLEFASGQPTLRVAGTGSSSLAGMRFGTSGASTAMHISNDGSVGLGLVPRAQLDVQHSVVSGVVPISNSTLVLERAGANYLSILSPDGFERGIYFGAPASNIHGGIFYRNSSGLSLRTGVNQTRVEIDGSGNTGMGTVGRSIDARLHVQADGARPMKVDRFTNDGELLVWARDDINVGTVSVAAGVVTYGAFTGVHYATLEAPTDAYMLVSMTGKNSVLGNKRSSEQANNETGETVYGVMPSARPNDPAVLGVYLASLDAVDYQHDAPIAQVAAVGNSDVWVVDNGTGEMIVPGDPLISSSVAGAAMKLDSAAFPMGNVFGKAAGIVDWSTVTPDANGVKRAKVSVLFSAYVHTDPSISERLLKLEALLDPSGQLTRPNMK